MAQILRDAARMGLAVQLNGRRTDREIAKSRRDEGILI